MKIGIITLYHKNVNYGAVLQAYALVKYLNCKEKIRAEQITYDAPFERRSIKEIYREQKAALLLIVLNKFFIEVKSRFFKKFKIGPYSKKSEIRLKKIEKFRDSIPHSKEFTKENIETANEDYDIFITGSDQVWNPTWYKSACFLDFVKSNKRKISYAASIGANDFSEEKKQKIIPLITRINNVSVREKKAKDILKKYIPSKSIEVVVDPVLLISQEEWNYIASSVITDKKYAFAYFLGSNKKNVKNARKAATIMGNNGLPIASIPYVQMILSKYEKVLEDIPLYDIGPEEFIGLIRDSEIVLTDSFHAIVFSIIFKKKFIAFKRDTDSKKNSMNSRLTDLLDELGLSDRIITTEKQLTKKFLEKDIDYTYAYQVLEKKRKHSMDFLDYAINS